VASLFHRFGVVKGSSAVSW